MTTTVISNQQPYGQLTNQTISRLIQLQVNVERLGDAVKTASAGYTGTPGTEFEAVPTGTFPPPNPNLFSVQPSTTPGEQGAAYKYAIGRLQEEWAKFWEVAQPFIEQLDNGIQAYP